MFLAFGGLDYTITGTATRTATRGFPTLVQRLNAAFDCECDYDISVHQEVCEKRKSLRI